MYRGLFGQCISSSMTRNPCKIFYVQNDQHLLQPNTLFQSIHIPYGLYWALKEVKINISESPNYCLFAVADAGAYDSKGEYFFYYTFYILFKEQSFELFESFLKISTATPTK